MAALVALELTMVALELTMVAPLPLIQVTAGRRVAERMGSPVRQAPFPLQLPSIVFCKVYNLLVLSRRLDP